MQIENVVNLAARQQQDPLVLDPKAPLSSARAFVGRVYTIGNTRTLHHHNGTFHVWTGTHYSLAEQTTLRATLYDFLDGAYRSTDKGKFAPFNPNRAKIDDVIDALAAVTNL